MMYKNLSSLSKAGRYIKPQNIKLQKRFETTTTHGLNLEKKKGSFLWKAVGITSLLSVGYSGTVYYAAHDAEFRKLYLQYAPLAQETLDYVEALEKEMNSPNPEKLKVFKDQLQTIVDSLKDKTSQLYNSINTNKVTEIKENINEPVPKSTTETVNKVKKSLSKPDVDEVHLRKLQQLASQLTKLNSEDPIMKELVVSIDKYIITNGKKNVTLEEHVYAYSKVLNALKELTPYLDQSLKDQIKPENELQTASLITEKALSKQKQELEASHEQSIKQIHQLYTEERNKLIEQFKYQVEQRLEQQSKSLERWWKRESRLLVDHERNGRLSKLDSVLQHVKLLENAFIQSKQLDSNNLINQKLNCAIDALENAIKNKDNKPFIEELRFIEKIESNNPLVQHVVASLKENIAIKGIPSLNSLKERFESVKQEVTSSGLVRENAGFFGHLTSYTLSWFLFKKQGLVEGNDVEAIIARSQFYLDKDDLEAATREVNQLNGWPKKLAQDWIAQAISRLEFEQAVEVLKTELRSINLANLG